MAKYARTAKVAQEAKIGELIKIFKKSNLA